MIFLTSLRARPFAFVALDSRFSVSVHMYAMVSKGLYACNMRYEQTYHTCVYVFTSLSLSLNATHITHSPRDMSISQRGKGRVSLPLLPPLPNTQFPRTSASASAISASTSAIFARFPAAPPMTAFVFFRIDADNSPNSRSYDANISDISAPSLSLCLRFPLLVFE